MKVNGWKGIADAPDEAVVLSFSIFPHDIPKHPVDEDLDCYAPPLLLILVLGSPFLAFDSYRSSLWRDLLRHSSAYHPLGLRLSHKGRQCGRSCD